MTEDVKKYDERSGKDEKSIVPKEIEKWNWGAFLIPLFWGIRHKQWLLSLLSLVPVLGFIVPFLFGFKGSKWAWQSCKWEGVEQFKESQKNWAFFGVAFLALFIMFYFLSNQ